MIGHAYYKKQSCMDFKIGGLKLLIVNFYIWKHLHILYEVRN